MNNDYIRIKDKCREGLVKYLETAISSIPPISNPQILDVGCGSGVPTMLIAKKFNDKITAIDTDVDLLNALKEKVNELNLFDKVKVLNCSLFELEHDKDKFDLIIAEGILNVVGFKKGFLKIKNLLNENGYIIIHDESKNYESKKELIEKNNCKILNSFMLDDQVWWDSYYKCLEKKIKLSSNKEMLKLFDSDLNEIKLFKRDPSQFSSRYYVIKKIL